MNAIWFCYVIQIVKNNIVPNNISKWRMKKTESQFVLFYSRN